MQFVYGVIERGQRGVEISLADPGQREIAEDDRAGLASVLQLCRGLLKEPLGFAVVAEGEVAGARQPSEVCGGEKIMGGVRAVGLLQMPFRAGCSRVEWMTDRVNPDARAFYRALGFEEFDGKVVYRADSTSAQGRT